MLIDDFLSKLEGVKKSGDGYLSRCPAHKDGTASLSIKSGDEGRLLLHCHAGCDLNAIVGSMGMKVAELFSTSAKKSGFNIVATYDYQDEIGGLIYQVCRLEPKDFRQRRPDTTSRDRWSWKLSGVRQVPYRLPELINDVASGKRVYIAEGEKDCQALVKAGFAATCNSGGAGKWKPEFSQYFKGADVVIISDKDKAGRKHANQVASMLHGTASCVRVIEVEDVAGKPCKDAADYFAAGGEASDLDELAQSAPIWEISCKTGQSAFEASLVEEQREVGDEEKTIPFIDAADAVCNPEPEPPVLVGGFLHKGCKMVVGGGSKSFKTFVLSNLAIAVATGSQWWGMDTVKGKVLYLNFELPPWSFTKRLKQISEAMGISIPRGSLHVANLRGQSIPSHEILRIIANQSEGYCLIILDPLYKLLAGRDENSAGDMGELMNEIDALANKTGASVAFGAHFSKGNQSGKESIDRISGSGVFARDPDAILVMTRHEEVDAFTVESTLRNLPPVKPFVVRWDFPLMRVDSNLDPSKLKQIGGRPKKNSVEDITRLLEEKSLSTAEWECLAKQNQISESSFARLKREALKDNLIHQSPINKRWQLVLKCQKVSKPVLAPSVVEVS